MIRILANDTVLGTRSGGVRGLEFRLVWNVLKRQRKYILCLRRCSVC